MCSVEMYHSVLPREYTLWIEREWEENREWLMYDAFKLMTEIAQAICGHSRNFKGAGVWVWEKRKGNIKLR